MKTAKVLVASVLALAAGCASNRNDSGREWQRAECNRIIDNESRVRCLKRVDDDYGTMAREREEQKKR
jgi:hypothetical protein